MNQSASVSLFANIFEQLVLLERLLLQQNGSMAGVSVANGPGGDNGPPNQLLEALVIVRELRQRLDQIGLLYDTARRLSRELPLRQVLDLTLDTIWQQAQYSFVVVLVGETELGPYYYREMRGVVDARRYLGKQCPLPLWGELARALVRRLDPNEPDYLIIPDVAASGRPRPEEFPWLERSGSLLLLPLRNENVAIGALLLGRSEPYGFANPELCMQLLEIGASVASGLIHAGTRQELQERADQLVGLQLYTKAITPALTLPALLRVIVNGASDLLDKAEICLLFRRSFFGDIDLDLTVGQAIGSGEDEFLVTGNWSQPADFLAKTHTLLRLTHWVIDAGQGLFLNPEQDFDAPEDLYFNDVGRALLTPIFLDNRALGAIYAIAPPGAPDFDESDMVVLRTLASVTAIALNLQRFAPQA